MSQAFCILASALFTTPLVPAFAQEATNVRNCGSGPVAAAPASIWTRPTLGGDWWGARPKLKDLGLTYELELTQFGAGMVSGEGSKDWQYGGKLDLFLRLNGAQAGLWKGLFITLRGTQNVGQDLDGTGGTLIPLNASLAIPGPGEGDIGLEVTQKLSEKVAIKFGKLNMVDAAKATPIKGGGGIETFMNTALAVPPTGLMPPEIFGAFLQLSTKPVSYALGVYDPISAAQRTILDDPFSEGVSFRASATLEAKPLGLQGFYAVKAMYSTMQGFDLRCIPDLLFPPETGPVLATQGHSHYVGVSFQQYVFQDAADPRRGWGFFGEIGCSDGNPTPQQWAGYFGIGGNGLRPHRVDDRWGVAVFRNSLSDSLVQGLMPLTELRDEEGLEVFYNLALTPWFHVSPDLQVVRPFQEGYPTAVFVALRANLRF